MKLINANAFVTSLMTLSVAVIPVTSNPQLATDNCSPTQILNDQLDIHSSQASSNSCIQNTVETIYNPNPDWRPNL